MTEDLTPEERVAVLQALATYRDEVLAQGARRDLDDEATMWDLELLDRIRSAVGKLGGDPDAGNYQPGQPPRPV